MTFDIFKKLYLSLQKKICDDEAVVIVHRHYIEYNKIDSDFVIYLWDPPAEKKIVYRAKDFLIALFYLLGEEEFSEGAVEKADSGKPRTRTNSRHSDSRKSNRLSGNGHGKAINESSFSGSGSIEMP